MAFPRTPSSSASRIAAFGTTVLVVAGCQSEVFGGKDTFSPRVEMRDYAQEKIDAGGRKGDVYGPNQRDPSAESIASLVDAVLAFQPRPSSVACLPLVSYDLKAGKPWVSEFGVATADAVASALKAKGLAGQAFATDDVGLRMTQTNVSRTSFTTLETVSANAERLGADLVVFGTIRRRDSVGALDRDVLSCEIQAYDVAGRRVATSARFEMPSDDVTLRRAWDLAQAESAWMPDSRYGVAQSTPALANELKRVSGDLAKSLGKTIDPSKIEGTVYVAPLDVAAFSPDVAILRSAQGAYAAEVTRRIDAGTAANAQAEFGGKIVLNGTEFPNFQAAEAHLTQLTANYQATSAARFAISFGSMLGDAIRERVLPAGKSVNDLAGIGPMDRVLVEGELAQGGLAKSAGARDALRNAKIGLVVASRLERIGDAISIRVDAYDLAQGADLGDGTATIPSALLPELQRALAPGPQASKSTPNASSPSTWPSVYDRVKSGVVKVEHSKGSGSGFIARDDGLVITNHHVVEGDVKDLTVTPEGGKPLRARVVATDPFWDLAAIAVDGLPQSTYVFKFADDVRVGTEVAVLGHPQDSLGWVLTPGYVSSLNELVPTPDGRARPSLMYTSPTRPGSSGSPVLLADGRVAAVHSAGTRAQSLTDPTHVTELTGFARGIPAIQARQFSENLPRP